MAQNVSATFHYRQNGEDRSVTKDGITVENYINAWIDRGITGVDLTLAQALADYGYYVQRFLSKTNGWSLDVDYTEMETKFTTSYDKDGIRQELNYYQPLSKQLYSSDVIRVDVTLSLDSETTLDLLLTTNENAEFDYVAMARLIGGIFQSFPYEPELVDGRYRIRIDGIRAQDFDKTIMVSGRTKNDAEESFFTIEASPLGYVSAALNADSFASNYGHEAMCALYNYYLATTNYIRAHHQ